MKPNTPGTDELITDLARRLPELPERELTASRRLVLKEHLITEFRQAGQAAHPASHSTAKRRAIGRAGRGRPRSRRILVTVTAGTAALAAVIAAIGLIPAAGHGPRPPANGAIRLLAQIAAVAGRQPAPRVHNSQYMYVQSRVANYAMYFGKLSPRDRRACATAPSLQDCAARVQRIGPDERQIWLSVSDLCRPGLLREGGGQATTLVPWTTSTKPPYGPLRPPHGTHCPDRGNLGDPTYRLLQSLPTSPRVLLRMIYAFDVTTGEPPRGSRADAAAFNTITSLAGETIAPPDVSAAVYRAAALIPGVRVIPHVLDALGRPGVAVALGPTEMIFNHRTLQLIGTFSRAPFGGRAGLKPAFTAIQVRAIVNRPGQVPGLP